MRIIKPTNNLQAFGFTDFDISNLDKILSSNLLKENIELEEINDQLFDFGAFISNIISDKALRQSFLKACYQELNDFPNCILNNISLDPNSFSFKLNLFILLVDCLDKTNKVNPLYVQFLEIDKHAYRKVNTILDAFFEMCRLGLIDSINTFNLFATSNTLERSGWVGTNVPVNHKESIAEHMYVMYIMANLYLPNEYQVIGYDKQKILKMIMIHDLAETITGDIPHPKKTNNDELQEDLIAKALWCNLLYNGLIVSKEMYETWDDWNLNLTINAQIAHDFDAIQLNYQFFTYACQYPNTYSDDNILSWTKRQPKTELGKAIYKKVIINNPKFESRISVIKGLYQYD